MAAIVVGSRDRQNFDAALVIYVRGLTQRAQIRPDEE
jgi:hypothetical protein